MIKFIEGTNNDYAVSTSGEVYSYKSGTQRLLSQHSGGTSKYLMVGLSIDGETRSKLVHRLVAEAFIPNPEGKPEVDHIDGDVFNNNVENLQWVTRKENLDKSKVDCSAANGMRTGARLYSPDGVLLGEFPSINAAAEFSTQFGCSKTGMMKYKRTKNGYYLEVDKNEKVERKKVEGNFRGKECTLLAPDGTSVGDFPSLAAAARWPQENIGEISVKSFQVYKQFSGYKIKGE